MEEDVWMSVSGFAKTIGVSKQTVYNRIKEGIYETKEFSGGKMKGILVKAPTD